MYNLRYTNPWGERTFFANLGGFWGPGDTRRLIERVTEKAENGRRFETVAEAREVLAISDNTVALPDEHGKVHGWEIVDKKGEVVK